MELKLCLKVVSLEESKNVKENAEVFIIEDLGIFFLEDTLQKNILHKE
jgi:hypothetical protein